MKVLEWLIAVLSILGGLALTVYGLCGLIKLPLEPFGWDRSTEGMDTNAGFVLLILGAAIALYGVGKLAVFGIKPRQTSDSDSVGPEV